MNPPKFTNANNAPEKVPAAQNKVKEKQMPPKRGDVLNDCPNPGNGRMQQKFKKRSKSPVSKQNKGKILTPLSSNKNHQTFSRKTCQMCCNREIHRRTQECMDSSQMVRSSKPITSFNNKFPFRIKSDNNRKGPKIYAM